MAVGGGTGFPVPLPSAFAQPHPEATFDLDGTLWKVTSLPDTDSSWSRAAGNELFEAAVSLSRAAYKGVQGEVPIDELLPAPTCHFHWAQRPYGAFFNTEILDGPLARGWVAYSNGYWAVSNGPELDLYEDSTGRSGFRSKFLSPITQLVSQEVFESFLPARLAASSFMEPSGQHLREMRSPLLDLPLWSVSAEAGRPGYDVGFNPADPSRGYEVVSLLAEGAMVNCSAFIGWRNLSGPEGIAHPDFIVLLAWEVNQPSWERAAQSLTDDSLRENVTLQVATFSARPQARLAADSELFPKPGRDFVQVVWMSERKTKVLSESERRLEGWQLPELPFYRASARSGSIPSQSLAPGRNRWLWLTFGGASLLGVIIAAFWKHRGRRTPAAG